LALAARDNQAPPGGAFDDTLSVVLFKIYHNFFRVDGTLDCGSRKLPRLGARSVMSLPCHYVGDTIER
jgi:hypothetical protein